MTEQQPPTTPQWARRRAARARHIGAASIPHLFRPTNTASPQPDPWSADATTSPPVWFHSSPAHIPDGEFVTPARERGGTSRAHPGGYGDSELKWYDPDAVYIFESGGTDLRQHVGRLAFVRPDYYWYEVKPDEPLGPDLDPGAPVMRSATCSRAEVIRCIHYPEPM